MRRKKKVENWGCLEIGCWETIYVVELRLQQGAD